MKTTKQLFLAAALFTGAASSLSAASLTWDRLGASPAAPVGGAGTWDTTNARWSDGVTDSVWNNANNDTAVFGGSVGTVTVGTNITVGGISFTNTSGAYTITGNTITLAGATPTINMGNIVSAVNSVITGTNGLTTTGTGTTARVNLGGANTFTGGLTIGANSIVQNSSSERIADSNDVTVNGGFRLAANETIAGLNGDGKVGASNGVTATLTVGSGNADGTFLGQLGTGILASDTSSKTNLIKIGTGTQVLSGANTFRVGTGSDSTVTVSGGTLRFAQQVSLYNNNTGSWTATNLTVASGATAAFNVGGTGEFTSADIDTLKALGGSSNGFTNGSRIGLDTTNAAGGNFSYANAIANTNGGANSLGLDKLGAGTLTLSGANTHTGGTAVKAGVLALASGGSIIVGAGDVTIASGATLALASGSTLHLASVSATIANAGTLSGAGDIDLGGFFNGWNSGASGSYALVIGGDSTGGLFTVSNYDTGVWSSVVFNGADGTLNFTAVPEPGTYGLLGAGVLAGSAFVRRRRRRLV